MKQAFEKNKFLQKIIHLFCVCYFSLVFYIVFLARRRRIDSAEYYKLHFTPLKNIIQFYTSGVSYTTKEYYEFYINLVGNVVMFIPLPFFLVSVFGIANNKKCIYIACCISIIIEFVQYIFSIGVADIDDVIFNTTGSLLGVGFNALALLLWRRIGMSV